MQQQLTSGQGQHILPVLPGTGPVSLPFPSAGHEEVLHEGTGVS